MSMENLEESKDKGIHIYFQLSGGLCSLLSNRVLKIL